MMNDLEERKKKEDQEKERRSSQPPPKPRSSEPTPKPRSSELATTTTNVNTPSTDKTTTTTPQPSVRPPKSQNIKSSITSVLFSNKNKKNIPQSPALEVIGVNPAMIPTTGAIINVRVRGGNPSDYKISLSGRDLTGRFRVLVSQKHDDITPLKIDCPGISHTIQDMEPAVLVVEDEGLGEKAEVEVYYYNEGDRLLPELKRSFSNSDTSKDVNQQGGNSSVNPVKSSSSSSITGNNNVVNNPNTTNGQITFKRVISKNLNH
eukprot:TRINITY_DN6153_c0_g1_i1.p1 TRINITY_DN6153_c0_g1~~TRINITY_DN6153_c0_g1_i1.p1  ORF type:complete len:262 (-),score=59.59 TRINITY_DN6153_c0_g1_i1:53-838(-)